MSHSLTYLDYDVLTAAKMRIRYTLQHFDHLVVSFSGGKDSLTVLNLVKQVYEEDGINKPVNVFFFDEEFVPTSTLNFINEIRKDPKLNFTYACLQMESELAYCGRIDTIIQWGKNRPKWTRPIPEYAVTDWDNIYDVYTVMNYIASLYNGKIANLTGVRAQESPTRRSMILAHKNDYPFVHKGKSNNIFTVTPIYDWVLEDVWKFLHDSNLDYNVNYNEQLYSGKKQLRVDTPLHAKGQRDLHLLKKIDPQFFAGLCDVFPELHAAAQYNNEYFAPELIDSTMMRYERSWRGILQYIEECVPDPQQKKQALFQLRQTRRNRINQSKKEKWAFTEPFYLYPLYHVFKEFIRKNFDKKIVALPPSGYQRKHFEYEGLDYDAWKERDAARLRAKAD